MICRSNNEQTSGKPRSKTVILENVMSEREEKCLARNSTIYENCTERQYDDFS
jgi:hypothetical protein